MALENLATAIGGTAIDHHIIKFRSAAIRRKQHALNPLLQMRRLVIGRRDDGNFHEEREDAKSNGWRVAGEGSY